MYFYSLRINVSLLNVLNCDFKDQFLCLILFSEGSEDRVGLQGCEET